VCTEHFDLFNILPHTLSQVVMRTLHNIQFVAKNKYQHNSMDDKRNGPILNSKTTTGMTGYDHVLKIGMLGSDKMR
jgi:hypothetical protein